MTPPAFEEIAVKLRAAPIVLLLLAGLLVQPSHEAVSADVPSIEPGKGLVVFYRPKKMKGAGIAFRIFESPGSSVGTLANGTVLFRQYEPGQRTFDANTPSVAGSDLITVDVVEGQVVYVRGEILLGWPAGRPKFTLMSEEQGRAAVSKL